MTDVNARRCIFLPLSGVETWAIPHNCLAEIVTLHSESEHPPEEINWRGRMLTVFDFDENGAAPWRETRGGTGLIAVILGLEGRGCDYMGVALRGGGLGIHDIAEETLEDRPDLALPRSLAAFRWSGATYQVPDLQGLQEQVASSGHS